jgi:aryl-alcohol dehydrogenase-like predicted oxidoreductase
VRWDESGEHRACRNGHSEKIVGDFFASRPGLRERVVLSTKFFGNLHPGDPNGGGAGRKALIAQLAESLRRLQTGYVDIYWLHNWDRLPGPSSNRGCRPVIDSLSERSSA